MGKVVIAVIAILAVLGVWWGSRKLMTPGGGSDSPNPVIVRMPDPLEISGDSYGFRTKASIRVSDDKRATHRPERLKDFILPEVLIEGLELEAALRKVLAAYQDACVFSGEMPLAIRFVVPPGSGRKLHLRLKSRNFKASVELLASLSGMKVSRDGLEYRFTRIDNERGTTKQTLAMPPDFHTRLKGLAGEQGGAEDLRDILKGMGLELDPTTRFTSDLHGGLVMETGSGADAAALTALFRLLAEHRPIQQKHTTKIIELNADLDWTPPDLNRMDDGQLQLFMRDMSQRKGVDMMTLPSLMTRDGEAGSVSIVREMIVPTDELGTTFETHNLGHVMDIRGSALGFGNELEFSYSHKEGELDPATNRPDIRELVAVEDAGFSGNNGTRLAVQTRPDGSRAIVLVTSTLLDPTGMPIE